jgi:hypothetical protein
VLDVSASRYLSASVAFTPTQENAHARIVLTPEAPPPPPPAAFLEPLQVDPSGHWFATISGFADYREISFFAAQSRMVRGEGESHVRPALRIIRATGITATRVFLTLGGDYWEDGPGGQLRAYPSDPGYWEQLDALVDMHAQEGLYTRFTLLAALEPFGGVWDSIARRDIFNGEVERRATEFVLAVAQRYANTDNVIFELVNEPVNIGFRSSSAKLERLGCAVKRIAPHRLLGAGDINGMDESAFFNACFDYVSRHIDRSPEVDFFAMTKRMGEDGYRDAQPRTIPAMSGEPANFGEDRLDGRRGDVVKNPAVAYAYGAVSRVRQIIPNFHYDGGLWANVPTEETLVALRAFNQALNAIPMVNGNRWRGNWSAEQGNYWSTRPYPEDDDERTVQDHVRNGRGPWRVFGIGEWSVAFPHVQGWNWASDLTSPATRVDAFEAGGFIVSLFRRQ